VLGFQLRRRFRASDWLHRTTCKIVAADGNFVSLTFRNSIQFFYMVWLMSLELMWKLKKLNLSRLVNCSRNRFIRVYVSGGNFSSLVSTRSWMVSMDRYFHPLSDGVTSDLVILCSRRSFLFFLSLDPSCILRFMLVAVSFSFGELSGISG
jgi:hypothetical protein